MRIRVAHETIYTYDRSAAYAIQTLRLTPRSHHGQFVCNWRIDVDADCRMDRDEDSFGNVTHTYTVDGPFDRLRVHAEGEVETEDTNGLVRDTVERLPVAFYLRGTELTAADAAIRSFAQELSAGEGGDTLATLHAMQRELHRIMRFDVEATSSATTAAEAFHARHGVCQDFAHIFVAGARFLSIPARYVGGYLLRGDGQVSQEAGHAWAEAMVPTLGWIGFDPANGTCVTDHHVRVAAGLDYLGAAPVRGARTGGIGEHLAVKVVVERSTGRTQLAPGATGPRLPAAKS
jgi:transglutaminase-like putative cysteine protease